MMAQAGSEGLLTSTPTSSPGRIIITMGIIFGILFVAPSHAIISRILTLLAGVGPPARICRN